MIDLVIFDCDGVLVDTEKVTHGVIARYLATFGVSITAAESHRRFVGVNVPTLEQIYRDEGADLPDDFTVQVRARIMAALAEGVEAIPGVAAALNRLPLPCCVASSGRHVKIRQSLRLAGLIDLFDDAHLFSAEDVARAKPAPDLFLHAARMMGAEPARTVVVEDSPPGIRGAVAAGMTVIGYREHADGPDPAALAALGAHHVIDHMGRLPDLLSAKGLL